MDLLGSILGSMEKPPTIDDKEKKRAKAQKALVEKEQLKEKQKLDDFREKMQKRIHEFIKDPTQPKLKFEPMDKVFRALIHDIADVAGLTSFSFGIEEEDRYVMIWKKEFCPSDEELNAYKRGEDWDPEKAKEAVKQKELEDRLNAEQLKNAGKTTPATNYRDKYKHLIGEEAAKDAAKNMKANKSYGFVPSDNKRDQRTIEQVLNDTRAKKKLKTEHHNDLSKQADTDESKQTDRDDTSDQS